jgi:hypothetical protein
MNAYGNCHFVCTLRRYKGRLFRNLRQEFAWPSLGPNDSNTKDTKPQMSPLLVCNRVYRLEIQSVMLVFSTQLFEILSLYLLSISPPPLPCVNKNVYVFIQCVCNGGIGLCGEHMQELYTVFDQILELQNCCTTPKNNLGGEGASDR